MADLGQKGILVWDLKNVGSLIGGRSLGTACFGRGLKRREYIFFISETWVDSISTSCAVHVPTPWGTPHMPSRWHCLSWGTVSAPCHPTLCGPCTSCSCTGLALSVFLGLSHKKAVLPNLGSSRMLDPSETPKRCLVAKL